MTMYSTRRRVHEDGFPAPTVALNAYWQPPARKRAKPHTEHADAVGVGHRPCARCDIPHKHDKTMKAAARPKTPKIFKNDAATCTSPDRCAVGPSGASGASGASLEDELIGILRYRCGEIRADVKLGAYNLYDGVGLAIPTTREEEEAVSAHLRRLAIAVHPDRNLAHAKTAAELFAHVGRVAEVLRDAGARRRYHELLAPHYRGRHGEMVERWYVPHGGARNTDWGELQRFLDGETREYLPASIHLRGADQLGPAPRPLHHAGILAETRRRLHENDRL